MSAGVYASVEETLLLLSEARERAERAVAEAAGADVPEDVAAALAEVDRELLALHRRLFEQVFPVEPRSTQLRLEVSQS